MLSPEWREIILISENTDQSKPHIFKCYLRPSAKKAILSETKYKLIIFWLFNNVIYINIFNV